MASSTRRKQKPITPKKGDEDDGVIRHKCAITGAPKASMHTITAAEQRNAETCQSCGDHYPWDGSEGHLHGRTGRWICVHCDKTDPVRTPGWEDDDGE